MRQPVSERSYRCRRIIPYSLQRTYTLVSRRELPAESFHHLTGSSQQITSPAIIAQSLPQFHHLVVIGGSQRPHIGKSGYESIVILEALHHPCLLQNNLRNPNTIRIGNTPPRQHPVILGVPRMQTGSQRRALFFLFCSFFHNSETKIEKGESRNKFIW